MNATGVASTGNSFDIQLMGIGGMWNNGASPRVPVTERLVLQPSQLIEFGDAIIIPPNRDELFGFFSFADHDSILSAQSRTISRKLESKRHGGVFDVACGDGHTESLRDRGYLAGIATISDAGTGTACRTRRISRLSDRRHRDAANFRGRVAKRLGPSLRAKCLKFCS